MERYPRDTNSSQIIKHFRLKCFIISSRFLVLCTTCLCDIGFVHKRKDKCRVKKYQKFKFKWSKIKFVEVVEYDTHFEITHNTTWCVLENPISRNGYIQKYMNSLCWDIIFISTFNLVYSTISLLQPFGKLINLALMWIDLHYIFKRVGIVFGKTQMSSDIFTMMWHIHLFSCQHILSMVTSMPAP